MQVARKIVVIFCTLLPMASFADECDAFGDLAKSVMKARQYQTSTKEQNIRLSNKIFLQEHRNETKYKLALMLIDKAYSMPIKKTSEDKKMEIGLFSYNAWKTCDLNRN